jgi:hypothetical protein
MFDSAQNAAKKYATRASFTINAVAILLIAFAYLAVHTGHARADIQLDGWSVGGGTDQHAAREQQLAALSNALPITAITPAPMKATVQPPLPTRKPTINQ